MNTKQKGVIAQLKVASDLVQRGYQVWEPHGEFGDIDLMFCREPDKPGAYQRVGPGEWIDRVQVKYTKSNGEYIKIRSRCHSVTAGRVGSTKYYTSQLIDWIAVYDDTSSTCYYIPARVLGDGMSELRLRLEGGNSNPSIRWAKDYLNPVWSSGQGRSPVTREVTDSNSVAGA